MYPQLLLLAVDPRCVEEVLVRKIDGSENILPQSICSLAWKLEFTFSPILAGAYRDRQKIFFLTFTAWI